MPDSVADVGCLFDNVYAAAAAAVAVGAAVVDGGGAVAAAAVAAAVVDGGAVAVGATPAALVLVPATEWSEWSRSQTGTWSAEQYRDV